MRLMMTYRTLKMLLNVNHRMVQMRLMMTVARVFYGYFNVVVSKASIGKNSVTERNLREIENKGIKGLSKEEISNFKLICAHFLK